MTDGEGRYGNNEYCVMTTLQPLIATATEFDLEARYDFLTIDGTRYHGNGAHTFPQELSLGQGAQLVWDSDGSVVRNGFTVCAAGSCAITPGPRDFAISSQIDSLMDTHSPLHTHIHLSICIHAYPHTH